MQKKKKKSVLDLGPSSFFQQVFYPFLEACAEVKGTPKYKAVVSFMKWEPQRGRHVVAHKTVNIHIYWAQINMWLEDRKYTTTGRKNGHGQSVTDGKQLIMDLP